MKLRSVCAEGVLPGGGQTACNLSVTHMTVRIRRRDAILARFSAAHRRCLAPSTCAPASVSRMEPQHEETPQSVEDITTRALAQARREFEQREARAREEIERAVRSYKAIDSLSEDLKKVRAELEASLDALAGLDVNRAVIAEALGITEGTLARRLPQKRKSGRGSAVSRRPQRGTTDDNVHGVI